jgi:hypothetical protein
MVLIRETTKESKYFENENSETIASPSELSSVPYCVATNQIIQVLKTMSKLKQFNYL